MSDLFSLEIEKHALSGLIKYPEIYADISGFVSEKDFWNPSHETIYCVLVNLINSGQKFDKIILAQKVRTFGLTFKDDINIFDYIDSICFSKISEKIAIESFKQLADLRIRRNLVGNAQEIIKTVRETKAEPLDKVVSIIDEVYSKGAKELFCEEEGKDLFASLVENVEFRGNNPVEEIGLASKHKTMNRLWGGFSPGNLYIYASRPGQGKTTFLIDLSLGMSEMSNWQSPTLYLDTEMFFSDQQFRLISKLSGVGMWFIKTGNWRRNEEMTKKVRAALSLIKNQRFYHYEVGNKTIDQICSLARRWKAKYIDKSSKYPFMLVYDYLKLTGEKTTNYNAEHQILGQKADTLKKLSEELGCILLSAGQLNRTGESQTRSHGQFIDDSTALAGSDKLLHYASGVYIFRQKTLEEFTEDGGERWGSHLLKRLKGREQGRDGGGYNERIFRTFADGSQKFCDNYLSFDVKNFDCRELGSLQDIINQQSEQHNIMDQTTTDPEVEL